jgi:hypothetical protein
MGQLSQAARGPNRAPVTDGAPARHSTRVCRCACAGARVQVRVCRCACAGVRVQVRVCRCAVARARQDLTENSCSRAIRQVHARQARRDVARRNVARRDVARRHVSGQFLPNPHAALRIFPAIPDIGPAHGAPARGVPSRHTLPAPRTPSARRRRWLQACVPFVARDRTTRPRLPLVSPRSLLTLCCAGLPAIALSLGQARPSATPFTRAELAHAAPPTRTDPFTPPASSRAPAPTARAAQDRLVTIRVLADADGSALANAEVIDRGTGARALTRENGEARVRLPLQGELLLRVRQLGYAYLDLTLEWATLPGGGERAGGRATRAHPLCPPLGLHHRRTRLPPDRRRREAARLVGARPAARRGGALRDVSHRRIRSAWRSSGTPSGAIVWDR